MIIRCSDVSKRYNQHWVIKKLTHTFEGDRIYGIMGANGSGKSTLIKMLSGFLSPTLGMIIYESDENEISRDDIYKYVSIWGPHTSLSGILTVREMIAYYGKMKGWQQNLSTEKVYEISELPVPINQRIDQLSSGQTQRLGLTITMLSRGTIVLLDEPGSYLDGTAKEWMQQLISTYKFNRLMVIASNDQDDLQQADETITL